MKSRVPRRGASDTALRLPGIWPSTSAEWALELTRWRGDATAYGGPSIVGVSDIVWVTEKGDFCDLTSPQLRDNLDGIRNRPADDPASDGPCTPGTYHSISPHVAAPSPRRTKPAGSDQRQ